MMVSNESRRLLPRFFGQHELFLANAVVGDQVRIVMIPIIRGFEVLSHARSQHSGIMKKTEIRNGLNIYINIPKSCVNCTNINRSIYE